MRRLTRKQAERMAEQAWEAYAALKRTEGREPGLAGNPFWRPLTDAAHARFRAYYECEAMK